MASAAVATSSSSCVGGNQLIDGVDIDTCTDDYKLNELVRINAHHLWIKLDSIIRIWFDLSWPIDWLCNFNWIELQLDNCNDYEGRRRIRARIKVLLSTNQAESIKQGNSILLSINRLLPSSFRLDSASN